MLTSLKEITYEFHDGKQLETRDLGGLKVCCWIADIKINLHFSFDIFIRELFR